MIDSYISLTYLTLYVQCELNCYACGGIAWFVLLIQQESIGMGLVVLLGLIIPFFIFLASEMMIDKVT